MLMLISSTSFPRLRRLCVEWRVRRKSLSSSLFFLLFTPFLPARQTPSVGGRGESEAAFERISALMIFYISSFDDYYLYVVLFTYALFFISVRRKAPHFSVSPRVLYSSFISRATRAPLLQRHDARFMPGLRARGGARYFDESRAPIDFIFLRAAISMPPRAAQRLILRVVQAERVSPDVAAP